LNFQKLLKKNQRYGDQESNILINNKPVQKPDMFFVNRIGFKKNFEKENI